MGYTVLYREKSRIYAITLVSRDKRQISGYYITFDKSRDNPFPREISSFEKLSDRIINIDADFYTSEGLEAHIKLIDPKKVFSWETTHLYGRTT